MSEQIKLADITPIPEIQIRVKLSPKTIEEYAAMMGDGVKFNDIDLFVDDQGRHILADGWHRMIAAQNRGLKSIAATVHPCEPAEAMSKALQMALQRNCSHGLKLSVADKRRSVELALADKEIRKQGDKAISRLCGVSPQLVADVRAGGKNKDKDKSVEVEGHSRSKATAPTVPAEHVEDTSDPTDERVRTLKDWVQSGKIDWPDIAAVFTNDKRVAMLVPLSGTKFQVIVPREGRDKAGRELEFEDIKLIHRGVDQLLQIRVKRTNEATE